MLNYGNEQNFVGKTDEEKVSIKREIILSSVDSRRKLLNTKRAEVNNTMYEMDLIAGDIASIIREDMEANAELNFFVDTPVTDVGAFLNDTWLEKSSANKEVYDNFSKEIKDRCKASAAIVLDAVNEKIIKNNADFKFLDIGKGDDGDYYWLEYEYKDVIAYFGLPVYSRANPRNFNSLLDGYIVGHKKPGENTVTFIARDFNCESLVPSFLNWYASTANQKEQPAPAVKAAPKKRKDAAN